MKRVVVILVALVVVMAGWGDSFSVRAQDGAPGDGPDYWPTDGWRTSTPEEQGMDSAQLAQVLLKIKRTGYNINSVTVIRNGYVVLDAYVHPFGPDEQHIIHSCTKSLISALIGIAINQGYLDGVDQRIVTIFPDKVSEGSDALKDAMTLEDVLMMANGLECRDSYLYNWRGLRELWASDDWVQHILSLPMSEEPGTRFEYCNSGSFLLSAIIQETTGMTALEFAQAELFGPLGFGPVEWMANPQGITIGWGDLHITPHDMAKFGYLYLREGAWDGQQIVPADWVAESTREHIHAGTLGDGYGYQWWIEGEQVYAAEGYAGQYIFVVPELDLVAVFTSGLAGQLFEMPEDLLRANIIPAAVSDEPLPANPDALVELTDLVDALANPEPEPVPELPAMAQTISGQRYVLEPLDGGAAAFTLVFSEGADEAAIILELADGQSYELAVGLDGVFRTTEDPDGDKISAKGFWLDEDTFMMDMRDVAAAMDSEIRLIFDGSTVRGRIRDVVAGISTLLTGAVAE